MAAHSGGEYTKAVQQASRLAMLHVSCLHGWQLSLNLLTCQHVVPKLLGKKREEPALQCMGVSWRGSGMGGVGGTNSAAALPGGQCRSPATCIKPIPHHFAHATLANQCPGQDEGCSRPPTCQQGSADPPGLMGL